MPDAPASAAERLERLPLSPYHRLIFVIIALAFFFDSMDLAMMTFLLGSIKAEFGLDSAQAGLLASSSFFGMVIGAALSGMLADRFGRKPVFQASIVLWGLASYLCSTAGDLGSLTFYRVLLGIGMGMEFPIAQSLLSEMIPASRRGKYIALMDGFWPLGFVAAGCLSYFLLPLTGWRSIFLVLALPAVFVLAIRFLIPESPRWLLSKGRDADAERVIRQVYGEAFSLENLPEQALERKVTIWHLLYAGYGKRMLFVTLFWTCSVIPVFAVYAFAPKVLLALNLKGDWASYGSVAITLLFVIGCIIATRLINRIGRRCMLLHSFLWSGLALLGLGVFHAGSEATILGLFGAYALFIGGAQVLQLVYPNELFPTEIRAFAVGVGTSLSRVGAAVGTYLVPLSLETLGTAQTMYAAALVTLLGLLVTWALAPETRSLNLQQAASLT
ncbi:MFS transporter [Pseudomonas aeruginosa]|nr:MFS transporter [Pseudomonas aeruginosa]